MSFSIAKNLTLGLFLLGSTSSCLPATQGKIYQNHTSGKPASGKKVIQIAPNKASKQVKKEKPKSWLHSTWWRVCHHTLAGALPIGVGTLQLYVAAHQEQFIKMLSGAMRLEEASGKLLQKVGVILEKVGIDPENGTVLQGNSSEKILMPACAIGNSILIIDENLAENIENEELSWTIAHEASHLKYHHSLKRPLFTLALPFISHYGLTWYDQFVQKLFDKALEKVNSEKYNYTHQSLQFIKHQSLQFIKKAHHHIATCWLTKVALSCYLYCKLSQYQEYSADKGATLAVGGAGGISSFEKHLQAQGSENPYDVIHPSIKNRIAYIKKLDPSCA